MMISPQNPRSSPRNLLLPATVGAMLALAGISGLASSASAHNYLVSSNPAAGATLTELPAEFDITTSDALLELGAGSEAFALRVTDSAGLYYGDGCVTIDGASMRSVASLGAPGAYTVTWAVVSTDGHPISDSYDFTWAPSTGASASKGSPTVPECGVTTIEADAPAGEVSPAPSGSEAPAASAAPTAPAGDTPATGDATTGASDPSDDAPITPWIVGGALAIAAAIATTVLLVRRRKS